MDGMGKAGFSWIHDILIGIIGPSKAGDLEGPLDPEGSWTYSAQNIHRSFDIWAFFL